MDNLSSLDGSQKLVISTEIDLSSYEDLSEPDPSLDEKLVEALKPFFEDDNIIKAILCIYHKQPIFRDVLSNMCIIKIAMNENEYELADTGSMVMEIATNMEELFGKLVENK